MKCLPLVALANVVNPSQQPNRQSLEVAVSNGPLLVKSYIHFHNNASTSQNQNVDAAPRVTETP